MPYTAETLKTEVSAREEELISGALVSTDYITRNLPWKREVKKLHYHDSTSSNDEFSSYAQSIKLILTTSTTHRVIDETLDFYPEGAPQSKFIHEGRLTTT